MTPPAIHLARTPVVEIEPVRLPRRALHYEGTRRDCRFEIWCIAEELGGDEDSPLCFFTVVSVS